MAEDRLSNIEGNVTRIENKVDKLGDAIANLVRLDERITTLFNGVQDLRQDVRSVSSRVLELEKGSGRIGVWGGIGDKVLYIVLGAFAAWAFKYLGAPHP